MSGLLLDTHMWLWVQAGTVQDFPPAVVREMEERQRRGELFVSAISVLEIARLVALGQFELPTSVDEFVATGTANDGFQLLDLSPRILIESTRLPGKIHRDPADRLLIATAREHGLTLMTRDKDILRYARDGHVRVRSV